MWCSSCQQDVPAVAGGDGRGSLVCPRCKAPLRHAETHAAQGTDWDPVGLDTDLRHAERLIRVGSAHRRMSGERRIGAASVFSSAISSTPSTDIPPAPSASPVREISPSAIGVWIAGVLLLMTGLAAVTMSLTARRGDLWTLGLVLAFTGQTVLILGLVVRLEWWGRKRTTTVTPTASPAKANPLAPHPPHFDLASLQRQLDLIAAQLRRQ